MKKINFILLIILSMFCIENVSAKDTLLKCEYYVPRNELAKGEIGYPAAVLCNIYTDYSHQCYMKLNASVATTSSNKEKIKNWTDNKIINWKAKEYVKEQNKCPEYLLVKVVGSYELRAAATSTDANQMLKSLDNTKWRIGAIKGSEEEKTKAKSDIEKKIKDINNRLNELNGCLNNSSVSDCENKNESLLSTIDSYNLQIKDYIKSKYFTENDQIIKDFRAAYKNAKDFATEYSKEIEVKKEENKTIQKNECTEYTYEQCISKTDKNGNICIKDKTTKTCRKKTSCGDFTTKSTCPKKSDVSKCKWNKTKKKCEKYDVLVCTDYNDKGSCPKKDEEGKACKWDSKKGCVYKNKSNSSTSSSSNSNSQTKSTLSKICSETGVLKSVRFLGYILFIVKIVVPIILIIMGSLDFGKAITTSNQDGLTKATKNLAVRVVAGVIIFILPTIVNFLFGMIVGLNKDYEDEMEGFNGCRTCLFSPDECNINK